MKKVLLVTLLSLVAYAQKPYMLIVVQPGCPACEELKQMISYSQSLKDAIEQYTSLQVLTKDEAQSVGFTVDMTPSIYFFAKEKRQLLSAPLKGVPQSAHEFTSHIKEIHDKYNKYLTTKPIQKQNSL